MEKKTVQLNEKYEISMKENNILQNKITYKMMN